MRTVLLLAHEFPPAGWSGVQRPLKFVQYLPDYGWQTIVVAGRFGMVSQEDASLCARIPPDTIVRRVNNPGPGTLPAYLAGVGEMIAALTSRVESPRAAAEALAWRINRLYDWTLFPDQCCLWVAPAVLAAASLLRRHRVEAIVTTAPPWSTHVAGLLLKRWTGLPWVADYRDPYTASGESWKPGRERLDRRLEDRFIHSADRVLCVTDALREKFREIYCTNGTVPPSRFVTVANGFDSRDLAQVPPEARPEGTARLRLVYSGSLYGGRQPDSFFDAVIRLGRDRPDVAADLEIIFAGRMPDYAARINAETGRSIFKQRGYIPHPEHCALIQSADVLIQFQPDTPLNRLLHTGKIFEYLAVGRHILAVIPPGGACADLLREVGGATIVDPADVRGIEDAIVSIHETWRRGELTPHRNAAGVNAYERKNLAGRLAEVLTDVAGAEGRR